MVKKLTAHDEPVLKAFAIQKPEANTFLIGNLEHFGMSAGFLDFWGDFGENGLVGVLMRFYRNFYIAYIKDVADISPFAELIGRNPEGVQSISGEDAVINAVSLFFKGAVIERATLCRLGERAAFDTAGLEDIRIAEPEDAERIFALIQTIEEFATFSTEQIRNTLRSKSGRIYYIENNEGKVVSAAQTAAENSVSAMIIGVCTDKDYRRRGLMRRVMTKLCADMQKLNKTICLFYSNPDAGKVYHELGFEPVGTWTMMKF